MKELSKQMLCNTAPGLKLDLETSDLPVVIQGWDKGETLLDVNLQYENGQGEEISVDDIFTTRHDEPKNTLAINISYIRAIRIIKAEILLHVPHETTANINLENAPVSIEDLAGKQEISSENGPLTLNKITGDIAINAENGPVFLKEIKGGINIQTENSPIEIRSTQGETEIKSENSPVKIVAAEGKLKVEAENGIIRILAAKLLKASLQCDNGMMYYDFASIEHGEFAFHNRNGKIHLIVPESLPVDLEAYNRNGSIRINLDAEYKRDTSEGSRKISMSRGSGKVKIKAENENGSIIIAGSSSTQQNRYDFSTISDLLEGVMESIPLDYQEKVRKGIEKAKKKIRNINFSTKIEAGIDKTMDSIEKTMKAELSEEKTAEIMDKISHSLKNSLQGVHKIITRDTEEDNESANRENSRLKILQMLQDGKISVVEAEKLLKATGITNE